MMKTKIWPTVILPANDNMFYSQFFAGLKSVMTILLVLSSGQCLAQEVTDSSSFESKSVKDSNIVYKAKKAVPGQVFYGVASYYGNKFHGKKTANGEIFSQDKYTAACNILPLGTWLKVTNLKNGKTVIVKTNDRLHPKMKRIVDLTRAAAKDLGYISRGLTKVKIEVISKPPARTVKKKKKK